MRVLMLSNCPVVEHQGSGYAIINTAKTLSGLGHQVEIIPPESFFCMSFLKGRAHIYRMVVGMARWIHTNRKSLAGFQLIIFYGAESFLSLFLIKYIYRIGVPVMLHSNGLEVHVGYRLKFYREYILDNRKWYHFNLWPFFLYCYKRVDAILTVSKYDHDFAIRELGIAPSKVFYNELCLPKVFFDHKDNEPIIKKKIITYCGTWIERKGIESIKGAIPGILRRYPEYSFRIVGVGNEFCLLKYFPEDIVERIEVIPLIQCKKQMIRLYSESSIFLFPSFCESFGLVVAEAMFCRCAVITGPTGFAASIKNDEAIVLEVPNVQFVTKALEQLINEQELRARLQQNARERTECLKWENYQKNMNEIIDKILKEAYFNMGRSFSPKSSDLIKKL